MQITLPLAIFLVSLGLGLAFMLWFLVCVTRELSGPTPADRSEISIEVYDSRTMMSWPARSGAFQTVSYSRRESRLSTTSLALGQRRQSFFRSAVQ